jgi:glycerate 2-kinase
MALEIENLNKEHLIQGIAIIPQKEAEKYPKKTGDNQFLCEIYPRGVHSKIRYFCGAENNLPDKFSLNATKKVYEMCKKLTKDDILLALISGGGSALLTLPLNINGVDSDEANFDLKLKIIKLIVSCGATINEVNTVRGCLSNIKSGKLALCAHPAQVISLIISDVIDDPLDIIASGPTYLTSSNEQQIVKALEILKKYNLEHEVPSHIIEYLKAGQNKSQSILPRDLRVLNYLIGNNRLATNSILTSLSTMNYDFKTILSNSIQGEAQIVGSLFAFLTYILIMLKCKRLSQRDVDNLSSEFMLQFESQNKFLNEILRETSSKLHVLKEFLNKIISNNFEHENVSQMCLIGGGETTVRLNSEHYNVKKSLGGRNMEMALAFQYVLKSLFSSQKVSLTNGFELVFSSYGSDGIDGPTDAAGAFIMLNSSESSNGEGLEEMKYFLLTHNSYNYFATYDKLIKTGPTGTNVSDLQILLIKF